MASIVLRGIKPYDGEYELEEGRPFNAREWRWIKKISGYMPFTITEGFGGGDPDLYVALAVIAMCRSGRIDRDDAFPTADVIAEAPFDGSITLVGDDTETEDDALPPALTSEPDASSPKSSLENENATKPKTSSPGKPSRSDLETSVPTLLRTGESSSDTSSESDLTSVAS